MQAPFIRESTTNKIGCGVNLGLIKLQSNTPEGKTLVTRPESSQALGRVGYNYMGDQDRFVQKLIEEQGFPMFLQEFSMISEYSQLCKASLLLQVLASAPIDVAIMQSLPELLHNSAIIFLTCDSAEFSVRFSGSSQGYLAVCFEALLPIYKAYGSDKDICDLLEVFDCDEIRAFSSSRPPVIQAYAMEFVRELLQVKICEVDEMTEVERMSALVFSGFYFHNTWSSPHPLHSEVQEEVNTNNHGIIRLLLQSASPLSVIAALENSLVMTDMVYVQRLIAFLNYFLSSTSYFTSAAKRGDFIVKLANAVGESDLALQVLGLCLQRQDLANELDKIRDLYSALLRSSEHFVFASTDLTRVFRMMEPNSRVFEDFERAFGETEDPERLIAMTEVIAGVIETCDKTATKQKLQEAYIVSLPIALIQVHRATRHSSLHKALVILMRSLLHMHRSLKDQCKKLSMSIERYLVTHKEAEVCCLEDLLLMLFGAESFELMSEVEFPELIGCFLDLIKTSRNDALVAQMLRHLTDLGSKSLYNISCFSCFGGRLLELAESKELRTDSLRLLELCGSYYVWPNFLRQFLDKLYECLMTDDYDFAGSLLTTLISMSSIEQRPYKLGSANRAKKGKRCLPYYSLHFRNSDSVFTSSLLAFFDKGLTVSFWIFPQTPGTIVTLLDESLKMVLTLEANSQLEVLVVKSGLAVSFPDLAALKLNEWSFVAFTVTQRFVSVHVNSKTCATEEVRCAFSDIMSINLGSCYARSSFQPSFKGEISDLLLLKGNLNEEILTSLYYSSFSGLDFLPQFRQEFIWYEDYLEPIRRSVDALKGMVTHFLDLSCSPPKLNSVEAVLIQDLDRSPKMTISNVQVCSGPVLVEAFHQIGGLKIWLFVMQEVGRSVHGDLSQLPVLEVFRLLKSLLEQENFQTFLEVCKHNLFDLLCAQLRKWKDAGICNLEVFKIATECAEITWFYKKCLNVVDDETEGAFLSYHNHPGTLRLALSFKLWKDLDQSEFFETVAALSEVTFYYNCHTALHMHLMDYYMSLARHCPAALESLRLKYQDKLFKTLRSHINLRSLLMLLLYERSKSMSSSAIQLILELTGSFAMSEFSDYISRSDKRLRSLLKNIYDLTVMLAEAPGASECLRYVGFTVEKLFNLHVTAISTYTRAESTVPALSLCEELVLKLAEVSSQRDTVRLVEHFVDECEALDIPYDFGRLLKIYFTCWSKMRDIETLRFAAEVLAQQFSKGELSRNYERLFVTCDEVLGTQPEFGEFVLKLMLCLANSLINSHIFKLLLYWAEDLQRHLGVVVSVELIRKLLELAIAEGIQHDIKPTIPRFSWLSPILIEAERPAVNAFSEREGGVLRILLSLSLRALLTESPEDSALLIRDLLDLHIPESYLRLKYAATVDPSVDFFAEDLNITAYAAAELLEMLIVRGDLRVPPVYSLALDLLLANGNNLLNCLDLQLNADIKANEFVLAHFSKISGGICQHQRTVLLYSVSRSPMTREERNHAMGFESKLKEIAKKKQYEILEAQLLDRSSPLASLHDFLVAYASMRVKAIEQVKPTYEVPVIKTPKFYSKKYLPGEHAGLRDLSPKQAAASLDP
jgi:hypothetical protein